MRCFAGCGAEYAKRKKEKKGEKKKRKREMKAGCESLRRMTTDGDLGSLT
jgi:hypothetical protein